MNCEIELAPISGPVWLSHQNIGLAARILLSASGGSRVKHEKLVPKLRK